MKGIYLLATENEFSLCGGEPLQRPTWIEASFVGTVAEQTVLRLVPGIAAGEGSCSCHHEDSHEGFTAGIRPVPSQVARDDIPAGSPHRLAREILPQTRREFFLVLTAAPEMLETRSTPAQSLRQKVGC